MADAGVHVAFDPLIPPEDWHIKLIRSGADGEGNPKPILANAIIALRESPEWKGVLAFNEFSAHVTTRKPAPHQDHAGDNWNDYDDARATEWVQHNGILAGSRVVAEAVQAVARETPFHPVRQYLEGLIWDQTPRLDSWVSDYLGADGNPYIRAVGPRWLISAIARVMRPGCQVDHCLMLEGRQGILKSAALRALTSDEWFTDHVSELGGKDSRLELRGKWIIEMSEFDRVRGVALERVKAFLTCRIDCYRVPYGRRSEDVPRQSVFAASVNDSTPFTDETGNRRFWPVRCGTVAIERLRRDRDQLWAEAFARYNAGQPWWLETAELNQLATEEQDERYVEGVWDQQILDWIEDPAQANDKGGLPIAPFDSDENKVTVTDILLHCVRKDFDRLTQQDRNQVARCLSHERWIRKRSGRGELRGKWFYVRPGHELH